MPQHGVTKLHRRNGKLQSCEPCRKRKLSCDHRLPTCGRCVKRGTTAECVYHPAPMTKPGRESRTTSPPGAPSTTDSSAASGLPAAAAAEQLTTPRDQWFDPETEVQKGLEGAVISPLGFLGESSVSTVVAELIDSLGEPQAEAVCAHSEDNITESMIQKGAAILYHLQGLESSLQRFLDSLIANDGYFLFRPIYNIFVAGTWRYLNSTLRKVPQGERLRTLSKLVWRNTQKPIRVSGGTTAEEWAYQATGENLRWETVGLLFSAVGLNAHHSDPSHEHGHLMLRLLDECIDNSRKCGCCTDLFACLLYERSPLVERIRGDISPEAWTRFSDVCNTALELGLHKEKVVNAQTPFFLCELRIRLFEAIYVHDKYVSTYLGRPPRISYRHCIVQLPADLSDDVVCGDQAGLEDAIARLDNGYARFGKIYRSTLRRARTAHFFIREEILEVVLGNPQTGVSSRVHEIRDRIQQSGQDIPAFAQVEPEQLLDNLRTGRSFDISGRDVPWRPLDVFQVLCFHCTRRHTDFLLERALVRRSKVDSARLISTARSLLGLAMKIIANGVYFTVHHNDLAELLAFYVVPSAAVLAIELLKHDQHGGYDENLPRSEIIQQLSVAASALEAVHVNDGNRSICELGRVALRKVLDRLLCPQRVNLPQAISRPFDDIDALFQPTNDMEFLSWLGEVDFDANNWLEGV